MPNAIVHEHWPKHGRYSSCEKGTKCIKIQILILYTEFGIKLLRLSKEGIETELSSSSS